MVWEYKYQVERKVVDITDSLNQFGALGWELIQYEDNETHRFMIFKRPFNKDPEE